jgi:hypothetical protein
LANVTERRFTAELIASAKARTFDWFSILLIHSFKEGRLEAAVVNQNWLFDS